MNYTEPIDEANENLNLVLPQVDDGWRAWIAESLLSGYSPESIANTLRRKKFHEQDIQAEIQLAMDSPYMKGTERLMNRKNHYAWILKNYSRLRRMSKEDNVVERRSKLGPEEFFEEYYFKNKPVIITDMVDDWPACRLWDLEYFRNKYGDQTVEIQYNRDIDKTYDSYPSKSYKSVQLREYIDLIVKHSPTNNFYLTARNNRNFAEFVQALEVDVRQLPYVKSMEGGNIWIGPAGTITSTHHDLSNNFMVQIMGRKRVFLAPPYEILHLYNDYNVYSPVDPVEIDDKAYPDAQNVNFAEYVLHPKEILFIPVGWWHSVRSLDIAITFTCSRLTFNYDDDYAAHFNSLKIGKS